MDYLISDLHLEENRPDITGAFFSFLDQIESQASRLYILGDFFESWIGDDENTPLQQEVKARLTQLSERGIQLYFMHGNRDFLVSEGFEQETGAKILPDPSVVELAGQKVLLMHGDSLCTKDTSYMKFRAMIRNPAFLKTFLARPIEDRITTARQLREMSQANNSEKSMEIMDVTPEEVSKEMLAHDVKVMIHGHTHRPMIHKLVLNNEPAQRIVLGDWDQKIWFITASENSGIQLHEQPFPAPTTS
jgi:UDP-2,3-diacylglucosamine hydrolase